MHCILLSLGPGSSLSIHEMLLCTVPNFQGVFLFSIFKADFMKSNLNINQSTASLSVRCHTIIYSDLFVDGCLLIFEKVILTLILFLLAVFFSRCNLIASSASRIVENKMTSRPVLESILEGPNLENQTRGHFIALNVRNLSRLVSG